LGNRKSNSALTYKNRQFFESAKFEDKAEMKFWMKLWLVSFEQKFLCEFKKMFTFASPK